jgi:hypothetical protein
MVLLPGLIKFRAQFISPMIEAQTEEENIKG